MYSSEGIRSQNIKSCTNKFRIHKGKQLQKCKSLLQIFDYLLGS